MDGNLVYKYTVAVVDAASDKRIYKRFPCISSDGTSNCSLLEMGRECMILTGYK